MRKCPFCNKEVSFGLPALLRLKEPPRWSFMHHCDDKTAVLITADTQEEILCIWEGNYGEEHSSEQ